MSNDNEPTSDRLCCHCGKVTKDHEFFQRDVERKWWVHFECITTISRQCVLDGDDFDRKLDELFPSVMGMRVIVIDRRQVLSVAAAVTDG